MRLRILYLEDNAAFAEQACRFFLAEHDVTIVPSQLAATSAMADHAYDVLLADYDLEVGKGDPVVREFRRKYPGKPIIAVSSHAAGNRSLQEAGASLVCSKMEFDKIGAILEKLHPTG